MSHPHHPARTSRRDAGATSAPAAERSASDRRDTTFSTAAAVAFQAAADSAPHVQAQQAFVATLQRSPALARQRHMLTVADPRGTAAQSGTVPAAGAGTQAFHPTAQRFARVPLDKQKPGRWAGLNTDLRVSDDGKMAVEDSEVFAGGKQLFLEAGVLADAKARLAAVSSPLTVDAGASTLQGPVPGKRKRTVTLTEVVPKASLAFGSIKGSGAAMTTLENCSVHGLDVMGAGARSQPNEAQIDVGGGRSIRNIDGMSAESDFAAKNDILAQIARRERKLPADAEVSRNLGHEVYNGLSERKRSAYAKEFGINQYARPQVGEGIEALRAGKSPAKQDANSGQGFPMHFAPVVARSGDDYVSLENFAKSTGDRAPGDTVTASNAWYYRMYGAEKSNEDQSYYGQHAQEASIGARAGLMGLTNVPKPKAADDE